MPAIKVRGFLSLLILLSYAGQQVLWGQSRKSVPLISLLDTISTLHQVTFNYDADLADTVRLGGIQGQTLAEKITWLNSQSPFQILNRHPHYILTPKPKILSTTKIIRGQIRDADSRLPLASATVAMVGSYQGTFADGNGNFELSVGTDVDSIAFSHLGYEKLTIALKSTKSPEKLKIKLTPIEIKIGDVLIREKAILPISFEATDGQFNLNADQVQLQSGWGEADVLRMVQTVPGIQAPDESSANLYVRGGTPDQTTILLDDIPVYKAGHFFGLFSTLDPRLASQLKIYKSGYGAAYGGQVAGLIEINNQLRDIFSWRGSIEINPINASLHVEAPLFKKKSSIILSTRNTISQKLRTPLFNSALNQKFQSGRIAEYRDVEDESLLNKNEARYTYEDFNLRWQYRFKKDDAITLSHFSSADMFNYDFELDWPGYTSATLDMNNSENRGSSVKVTNRWTPWWQSSLNVVDSKFKNIYHAQWTGDLKDEFQIRAIQENSLDHNRLTFDQKFDIATSQVFNFGLEFNKWDIAFNTTYEKIWESMPDTFTLDLSNEVFSPYFDYQVNLKDQLFIRAGLRMNKLNEFKEKEWEPRLDLKYKFKDSPWLIKANLGTYRQFISQVVLDRSEDNLGIDNGIWITTELNVVPVVRSRDFTLGVTYQDHGWTIDLEAYQKKTEGLTALNLRLDRTDNEISPGQSQAAGIELLVQKKINRYRSLVSYNLAHIDYQFPEFNRREFFPAPHDRRHSILWNHLWTLGNLDIVCSWHFGSGLPFSIPERILSRSSDDGELYHELNFERRNTERLPSYHRMDLSIHYRWIRPKMQIHSSFSLFNLYNRDNILQRRYQVWYPEEDRQSPELTYLDRKGLQLTPSLMFSLAF